MNISNTEEKRFYSNGQLHMRENFKDGERDGLDEIFYRNGQLEQRMTYKDGKVDGLWESFDENGNLDGTQTFINGKKVCVQNTPKNTPSESQQNQGVESPDLDVQKGNVS